MFPNAMVDRITPVSKQSDIDYVVDAYGVSDEWPITCESFTQWVIEDSFCDGRPNWDNAGAQFVKDVTPFETMKIRLLNAGHSVLGLLGSVHGYGTIDETVSGCASLLITACLFSGANKKSIIEPITVLSIVPFGCLTVNV